MIVKIQLDLIQHRLDAFFDRLDQLAETRALFGCNLADALLAGGQFALLAQILRAQIGKGALLIVGRFEIEFRQRV